MPTSSAAPWIGVPVSCRATGGPRRRVTTPTRSTAGVASEAPQARDGERAAAEEDGPRRTVGPLVGHARALVASRTSASSSSPGADRHQLVHRLEVVDVELAVEVIELVLERPTEQPGARRP